MAIVNLIEDEHILLQGLDPNQLSDEYVQWMQDSEVLQFLAQSNSLHTRSSLSKFVSSMNESPYDYLFGIFDKTTRRHIGNIKIGSINETHKFADVGFVIGVKEYWGKGIATRALTLVTRYAFETLRLNKLFAGVLAPNEPSNKVFEKAGYRQVGFYKNHYLLNGRYVDSFIFERCASSGI